MDRHLFLPLGNHSSQLQFEIWLTLLSGFSYKMDMLSSATRSCLKNIRKPWPRVEPRRDNDKGSQPIRRVTESLDIILLFKTQKSSSANYTMCENWDTGPLPSCFAEPMPYTFCSQLTQFMSTTIVPTIMPQFVTGSSAAPTIPSSWGHEMEAWGHCVSTSSCLSLQFLMHVLLSSSVVAPNNVHMFVANSEWFAYHAQPENAEMVNFVR